MDEPNEVLSEKTGVADCTEASREASADHDRQAEGRTRRFPFRKARGAAFALAVCAVAAGLTFRIGIGTPSAFGIESIGMSDSIYCITLILHSENLIVMDELFRKLPKC